MPPAVPDPAPSDSSRSQAAGGTGTGAVGDGTGPATGVAPLQPDARIALSPRAIGRVQRTTVEAVDSIVELVVGIVRDSIAIANAQRKPGDWTKTDENGRVWGWDPHLKLAGQLVAAAALAIENVGVRVAAGVLNPVAAYLDPVLGCENLVFMVPTPFGESIPIDVIY